MSGSADQLDYHSRWYQLIENLQASPVEFYASVEAAIEKRNLPEIHQERVDHHEGGPFSAKREYLRVRHRKLVFDICGAPLGNGFFVSWWLVDARKGPLLLFAILNGLLAVIVWAFWVKFAFGLLVLFVGIPAFLWFLARHPPEQLEGWDDPIVAIPQFGPVYHQWFHRPTYYRADTADMYQESIRRAVQEVVNQMTQTNGLRELTEAEHKPILRDLVRG